MSPLIPVAVLLIPLFSAYPFLYILSTDKPPIQWYRDYGYGIPWGILAFFAIWYAVIGLVIGGIAFLNV